MLIDFRAAQIQQFLAIIDRIQQHPAEYLDWQNVADFYQAAWLAELPKAVDYAVSGLDDGAEAFAVKLSLYGHVFYINCDAEVQTEYRRYNEGQY